MSVGVPELWRIVETVHDPELPFLTLTDLGVIRHVRSDHDGVRIGVTPTYTGCPATEVIRESLRRALTAAGITAVTIENVLNPPWTTDWITPRGRERLQAHGIVPPAEPASSRQALFGVRAGVPCPRCASSHTQLVSEFGTTPCKALFKCGDCLEPFEYFKCL